MRGLSPTVIRNLALIAGISLVVAGCTGTNSSPSEPKSASGAGAASSSDASTDGLISSVYSEYLNSDVKPIASANGRLPLVGSETIAARADILSAGASGATTVLKWRVATEVKRGGIFANMFGEGGAKDTSAVVLISNSSNQRLWPNRIAYPANPSVCACSQMPQELGPDGVILSGEYPPLAASIADVQVSIPGFAPITVPVTRL